MRDYETILDLVEESRSLQTALDGLETVLVKRAQLSGVSSKIRLLVREPEEGYQPVSKSLYVDLTPSISFRPVGLSDATVLNLGDSFPAVNLFYNDSDSYLTFYQDGVKVSEVSPYSLGNTKGVRGTSVVLNSIAVRPSVIPIPS